jgi:hypothetical protein
MKYRILISETLNRTVEVDAADADTAKSKVEEMYFNEEIVLDYSDFAGVEMYVLKN